MKIYPPPVSRRGLVFIDWDYGGASIQSGYHVVYLLCGSTESASIDGAAPGVDPLETTVFSRSHSALACFVISVLSSVPFLVRVFARHNFRLPSCTTPGAGCQPSRACSDGTRADERCILEKLPPPHLHHTPAAAATDHGCPLAHEGKPFRS